jgi:predicted enzyme related to lactoylglutathione lyase
MRAPEPAWPIWLYYFGVERVEGAIARITAGGGTVLHGPSEVPGGALIVRARDPEGAAFALVGPA